MSYGLTTYQDSARREDLKGAKRMTKKKVKKVAKKATKSKKAAIHKMPGGMMMSDKQMAKMHKKSSMM